MAYLGAQPSRGQWRKLSDISSGFNGSATSFTLSVPPGTSQYYVTPGSASQLLISLGGVIQQPDVDYTVNTNTITFTTAPTAGLSFFGVLCGDALNAGTPADGSVTDAKLASLTTVNVTNLKNASSGSNNIVLNTDGTTTIAAPSNIIKSGTAVASTSGTAIDFTGIPSWVKRVTVMFEGVSTNGASNLLVQTGSGSFDTTGYLCAGTQLNAATLVTANSTAGYLIQSGASANTISGALRIALIATNSWVAEGVFGFSNTTTTCTVAGARGTSGALDRIRITTVNGTDSFDAGRINILWEG